MKTKHSNEDIVVNVLGVLTEPIVKMIKDHVNHSHVFNEVNIYFIKKFYNNFCYYLGDCINISSTEFECKCNPGYEGERCEKTVDFCANVTCQNRGVCFPQYLNYTCHCLAGFNGRLCETVDTNTIIHTYVSKSNFI